MARLTYTSILRNNMKIHSSELAKSMCRLQEPREQPSDV